MNDPIHIISLGAGVQSSTMALMAAHGEITPMPTCAVFADTGDEPGEVMQWLGRLETMLPFPVHRVMSHHGTLSENLFKGNHSQIPAFKAGTIGKRQCTSHWKVRPIRRKIQQVRNSRKVKLWIGISLDEIWRMKPSGINYIEHTFPLIELRIKRSYCAKWLSSHGFNQVPKSACVFCPYHSDRQWVQFRKQNGAEWTKIVNIDRKLNAREEFIHRTCTPIDQVNLSDSVRGQFDLFNNECEGMCGV